MSVIQTMKGIELPISVSLEDRFGPFALYIPGEAEDGGEVATRQKGQWWKENSGEIIQALPDIFCTIFPKQCKGRRTDSTPPVIIQQGNQRDWMTTALLVIIVVVLIIVLLKK